MAQALNSTVNIINSAVNSSQGGPSSGGSAGTGGTGGNSQPEKPVEEKNANGGGKTGVASTEPVKKMYCN
ncbi:hypothetical protein GJ695_29000 [Pseudoduganella sp. FT9W]|nr:hypothetical protein [Duganella alba]